MRPDCQKIGLRSVLRGVFVTLLVLVSDITLADSADGAGPTVAVLDFELHDLTLMPGLEVEVKRTASIAPMLREILESQYGIKTTQVSADAQLAAEKGAGYLFEHHDVVAELGRRAATDLVVVGRVHKASFLFVYFKALLIDTTTNQPIADLVVEVKGTQERLTRKGVESLAQQIADIIIES